VLRLLILPLSTILLFDFGTVPAVWYFLELFRQCGIFWNCSDSVIFFGTVHTTALSTTEAESCSNSGQESGLVNFVNNLFREEQLMVGEAAVK
jgi:hypothetical protein